MVEKSPSAAGLARIPGLVLVALAALVLASSPARAIPAFTRKCRTSCLTWHTVYPKLTPFGEAFRRTGYRFPGVDGEFVKQDSIAMGQEAYKKVFPLVSTARPGDSCSSHPGRSRCRSDHL